MRIGEVAQRAGVNIQTLRYYERRGLLPAPVRRASGYREYGPDTVSLVRFIKGAQELGFTLREVGELIELGENGGRSFLEVRALATAKIADIHLRMRRLAAMKQALEELVQVCRTTGSTGHCPIIEAMEEASRPDVSGACHPLSPNGGCNAAS
jgi:Hg(II)-responsive transcriptional regulator